MNNKVEKSRYIKRVIITVSLTLLMSLTLTGCQLLKETFGKEYRMIDNAFDQLEADVMYTLEEYAKEEGFTEEDWDERRIYLDQYVAGIKVMRSQTKSWLREGLYMQEQMGTNVDTVSYVNKALIEVRLKVDEELRTISDGAITLKSTKVHRGFFGSIWYFVRNHWLITLIILGVLSNIWESVEDKVYKWLDDYNKKMSKKKVRIYGDGLGCPRICILSKI